MDNEEQLKMLRSYLGAHEAAHSGLDDLDSIIELTKANESGSRIRIDVSLARGLSYYTGSIMEISVNGIGSLGGGGRYDNLVGMFSGQNIPASGLSLGLERIIVVMTERDMFPAKLVSTPADVMVTIWKEHLIGESLALANELRSAGLRVDVYPEADKMGKQFKYASSRGLPFVAILGDDERALGTVSIKDMRLGTQHSVKRAELAASLREAL
jgi:histidyl-tRNA synthetase